MPTTDEIMAQAPTVDSVSGAAAANVLEGGKIWGLLPGAGWELLTGTLTEQTPDDSTVNQLAGVYDAFDLSAVDADLATGNIRSGVTIFGVAGKTEVVDTTTGNAVGGEILTGKIAWVDGSAVTGTMANVGQQTVTPGTSAQTITQGYHDGTGSVAGDADLTAGNIKKDVEIFGVTGTYEGGTGGAGVPKTGQTIQYAVGDDGGLQKGVAWPVPRFTDNSNGTVTDHLTGLIWLKNANVPGGRSWADALADVTELNSGGTMNGNSAGDTSNGGSHQTDWRLPNWNELHSLIDASQANPALPSGHPFTGVQSDYYWSGTTCAAGTGAAWGVHLDGGNVGSVNKTTTYYRQSEK